MSRRRLLIVLAVAYLLGANLRAGWIGYRVVRQARGGLLEFPDELQYWRMARSLARGQGLIDEWGYRATRMPAYPAFLSLWGPDERGVIRAKLAQTLLASLGAVFAALLAYRLGGLIAAAVAGGLVAADPFLVFFNGLLLTESLVIVGLTALWWVSWPLVIPPDTDRKAGTGVLRWLAAAVLMALCIYLRPNEAGLFVLWALVVIALPSRRGGPVAAGAAGDAADIAAPASHARRARPLTRRLGRALRLAAMAGVILIALLPWAVRNRRVTGHWCWLTTRLGITLYDGLRPGATGASDLGHARYIPEVQGLDEAAWNRFFRSRALTAAREQPGRILRLAWIKLQRTWNPLPNVQTYQSRAVRAVSAAWTVPIYVLAAAGVWVLRREGAAVVLLLLPATYVAVVHMILVGSVRYRIPAMPFLEVLAAIGLCGLAAGLARGPARTRPANA